MKSFTNRHAAVFLLALLVPLTWYVFTADWTFRTMRDGTMIGAFPLVYLGIMAVTATMIGVGRARHERLADIADVTAAGLARVAVFISGAILLTFFHERYGFVLLGAGFIAVTSWFAGQRRLTTIAIYAITVAFALLALFTLLGFDLKIGPAALGLD